MRSRNIFKIIYVQWLLTPVNLNFLCNAADNVCFEKMALNNSHIAESLFSGSTIFTVLVFCWEKIEKNPMSFLNAVAKENGLTPIICSIMLLL